MGQPYGVCGTIQEKNGDLKMRVFLIAVERNGKTKYRKLINTINCRSKENACNTADALITYSHFNCDA